MKMHSNPSADASLLEGGGPNRLLRLALLLALLGLGAGTAYASGGGGGSSNPGGSTDGSTNTSTPGDEVTSLPLISGPTGLTFVGQLAEIRALVLSVDGRGQIFVQRQRTGELAVTLEGNYAVSLDRAQLARTRVQILFQAGERFQIGRAHLELFGGSESFFPAATIALPLARLAGAPAVQGTGLELDVVGLRQDRYKTIARFERASVTLVQVDRGLAR